MVIEIKIRAPNNVENLSESFAVGLFLLNREMKMPDFGRSIIFVFVRERILFTSIIIFKPFQ